MKACERDELWFSAVRAVRRRAIAEPTMVQNWASELTATVVAPASLVQPSAWRANQTPAAAGRSRAVDPPPPPRRPLDPPWAALPLPAAAPAGAEDPSIRSTGTPKSTSTTNTSTVRPAPSWLTAVNRSAAALTAAPAAGHMLSPPPAATQSVPGAAWPLSPPSRVWVLPAPLAPKVNRVPGVLRRTHATNCAAEPSHTAQVLCVAGHPTSYPSPTLSLPPRTRLTRTGAGPGSGFSRRGRRA